MMWHEKLRNTTAKQFIGGFQSIDGGQCALTAIHDGDIEAATKELISFDIVHCNCPSCPKYSFSLAGLVVHLNDGHGYSFQTIADIIQPIEEEHMVETKELEFA